MTIDGHTAVTVVMALLGFALAYGLLRGRLETQGATIVKRLDEMTADNKATSAALGALQTSVAGMNATIAAMTSSRDVRAGVFENELGTVRQELRDFSRRIARLEGRADSDVTETS